MKFLHALIEKVKSIFTKNKIVDEELLLEQSNWVDLTPEELALEDEKTKDLKVNYQLFKSLKPYDIVLVKMNEHAIVDKDADESHFTRPFLITEKNDNGSIYGYYMTGSTNTTYSNRRYKGRKVIASKEKYNFSKNGLIDYDRPDTIFFKNLIYKKGHLGGEDARKLKKYISLVEGKSVIHNSSNRVLEEGDIVYKDNDIHLVYTLDNTNAYMYKLIPASHEFDGDMYDFYYIQNNGKTYYVSFNNNVIIDLKKKEVEIVDKWDMGKVLLVQQNKKNLKLLRKGIIKCDN